jgi:hypothetical protein
VRIWLQSLQNVNFLSKKFNMGSKSADFDADFKSVEKVAKRPTRKNLED